MSREFEEERVSSASNSKHLVDVVQVARARHHIRVPTERGGRYEVARGGHLAEGEAAEEDELVGGAHVAALGGEEDGAVPGAGAGLELIRPIGALRHHSAAAQHGPPVSRVRHRRRGARARRRVGGGARLRGRVRRRARARRPLVLKARLLLALPVAAAALVLVRVQLEGARGAAPRARARALASAVHLLQLDALDACLHLLVDAVADGAFPARLLVLVHHRFLAHRPRLVVHVLLRRRQHLAVPHAAGDLRRHGHLGSLEGRRACAAA